MKYRVGQTYIYEGVYDPCYGQKATIVSINENQRHPYYINVFNPRINRIDTFSVYEKSLKPVKTGKLFDGRTIK